MRERGKGENKGRRRELTPFRKFLDLPRILVRLVLFPHVGQITSLSKANFYVIYIHTLIRFFSGKMPIKTKAKPPKTLKY